VKLRSAALTPSGPFPFPEKQGGVDLLLPSRCSVTGSIRSWFSYETTCALGRCSWLKHAKLRPAQYLGR
jgi:hypothetical protein